MENSLFCNNINKLIWYIYLLDDILAVSCFLDLLICKSLSDHGILVGINRDIQLSLELSVDLNNDLDRIVNAECRTDSLPNSAH